MKTIDLTTNPADMTELFQLAQEQQVFVRTPEGKVFVITEVMPGDIEDDFAIEIALTRRNKALMALLAERSKEPGRYTSAQVRARLGLTSVAE